MNRHRSMTIRKVESLRDLKNYDALCFLENFARFGAFDVWLFN